MRLHQSSNPDHTQKTQEKICMRVTTSQCETSGKNHILKLLSQSEFRTLQSIIYQLEKEHLLEKASFWREVEVV